MVRQKAQRLLSKDVGDEHMPELPSSGLIDDRRKRLLIYGRRAKTFVFMKYVPPPIDDGELEAALDVVQPESEGNEEEEAVVEDADTKVDGEDGNRGAQAADDEEEESFMNKLVIDADNTQDLGGGLAAYFRADVILGPNAFVETANGFEDYAAAMEIKLLRELDGLVLSMK